MIFNDLFDLVRLNLDVSGHPAIVLVYVYDRFQIAGTYASCDSEFSIEIIGLKLLFEFSSGFFRACGYTAGTLSNYYFHHLPPILLLQSL